jgi:hypothetical protein
VASRLPETSRGPLPASPPHHPGASAIPLSGEFDDRKATPAAPAYDDATKVRADRFLSINHAFIPDHAGQCAGMGMTWKIRSPYRMQRGYC